jgi:hypothetical protein
VVKELSDRGAHTSGSVSANRVDASGITMAHERCINSVHELLDQSGVGTTLLVADGTPVVFKVSEVPPCVSVGPVSGLREQRNGFVFGVALQQCQAQFDFIHGIAPFTPDGMGIRTVWLRPVLTMRLRTAFQARLVS